MSVSSQQIGDIYQQHSRQVLATLIRLLGDFTLAEESLQDAIAAALQQWPRDGIPDNPSAWLIRIGHRRGIDQIRRRQTARHYAQLAGQTEEEQADSFVEPDRQSIVDDQLRLLFICCHPILSSEARLALTLREMCNLSTEQVASALLQKTTTVAQRIVRAKRKIREQQIPYEVPGTDELPQRLPDVLRVVYLMFNEGYSQSSGTALLNVDLANEAIRLGRELTVLLPHGEVFGLMALMLLQHSRRHARLDKEGELITLEEQDRQRWDRQAIAEGLQWLERALAQTPTSAYTLQASIAAEHAQAPDSTQTDWRRITRLYEALYQQQPSPVIALNHAVAVAMRDSPEAGLQLLDGLATHKAIVNYHLFHAAKADLLRRAGLREAALLSYRRALSLSNQAPEQRYLSRRICELENA